MKIKLGFLEYNAYVCTIKIKEPSEESPKPNYEKHERIMNKDTKIKMIVMYAILLTILALSFCSCTEDENFDCLEHNEMIDRKIEILKGGKYYGGLTPKMKVDKDVVRKIRELEDKKCEL